jgi:2-polyprenyl-3-methyl-5-hydroxy-6-metoxy-1,4-benzoquinol methylase
VSGYFDLHHGDWDAIYSAPVGSVRWKLNRRFRRAVLRRMTVALDECRDAGARSVLDIGCGTGELGVRLAAAGATRVLGIDVAGEMVQVATSHAVRRGVAGVCEYAKGDFMTHPLGAERFDCVVALGVFDYVADPGAFLGAMWSRTRRRLVASFPHSVPPRSWLRTVWHGLHGSKLHYFTGDDVRRRGMRLAPSALRIHTLPGSDRTYVLVCEAPGGARS